MDVYNGKRGKYHDIVQMFSTFCNFDCQNISKNMTWKKPTLCVWHNIQLSHSPSSLTVCHYESIFNVVGLIFPHHTLWSDFINRSVSFRCIRGNAAIQQCENTVVSIWWCVMAWWWYSSSPTEIMYSNFYLNCWAHSDLKINSFVHYLLGNSWYNVNNIKLKQYSRKLVSYYYDF